MLGRKLRIEYSVSFRNRLVAISVEIARIASDIDTGNNFVDRIQSAIERRAYHPTGNQSHLSSDGNEYFHIVIDRKWVVYYRIVDDVMLVVDVSYYGI